jgi:isochorismate synthase EntC
VSEQLHQALDRLGKKEKELESKQVIVDMLAEQLKEHKEKVSVRCHLCITEGRQVTLKALHVNCAAEAAGADVARQHSVHRGPEGVDRIRDEWV